MPNLKNLPENAYEGFRRVCEEGNYAFTTDEDDFHTLKHSCEIVEVPQASFHLQGSFIISKKSPYHRIFNYQ